jgi:hypothetical protein
MPLQSDMLPEDEAYDGVNPGVAADTTISLTGIPEIDALLVKVTDSATQDKLKAYVYNNLLAAPKLSVAANKRAVYTAVNSGSGFQYTFTNTDIAWLARSLHGEGGAGVSRTKASALAWTMFNRFMLNPRHFGTTSFWVFLQGFSQPVNPKWRSDGQFCRVGGKYHASEYCSLKKLSRRDNVAFGQIPKTCLKYAEEMAVGALEQPSKTYVDFASYKGMSKYGDNVGGDNFLTPADSAAWAKDQGATSIAWLSGKVNKVNTVTVSTDDVLEPKKKNELLAYLTEFVQGDQRALQNSQVTKAESNNSAGTVAQQSATQKLRQTANAVQMTITQANIQLATPSNIGTGEDGQQIGSDDTWSYKG